MKKVSEDVRWWSGADTPHPQSEALKPKTNLLNNIPKP